MIVKDLNGNTLDEYDLTLGKLTAQTETVHHEAVAGIQEQGYWQTLVEYPNGGKDVAWVVEVEGVKAQEAYDEQIDYQLYTPYSEEELSELQANRTPSLEERIADLQEQIDLLLSGATQ